MTLSVRSKLALLSCFPMVMISQPTIIIKPSQSLVFAEDWSEPKQKNRSYDAPGKARRKKGKR